MPRLEPTLLAAHIRRMIAPESESLTDAELVGRYAEHRDAGAFEVLVWRHAPMIWASCCRILRHQHDIEDAFQATFLAFARAAGTLGSRQAVGGWLHRVAVNAALKLKADRVTTGLTAESPTRPDTDCGELVGAVDEELDRLPDRIRAAFVLCCLEGMTNAEAARELGCPVGTVDSRLHAARVRLRDRLARRGFGPGVLAGLAVLTTPSAVLVAAAVRVAAGRPTTPAVAALAAHAGRITTHGAITMKIGICAVLALAATVWAFGSNRVTLPESNALAAPPPIVGPVPGEGRIVLWRDGHPIAFAPGTERTQTLCTGFDGKAGRLRIGPDGKVLIYLANRPTLRPVDPKKQDKLYLRVGLETKEVDVGGYSCHAFWGADGVVYGYGFVAPKSGDPEPPPDLTADLLNWSFDPRTGKVKSLKLPGNVSVLDRSPDGKAFLVLRYEKPRNPPAEAPMGAAQYRLGLLPADGGEFVPLTKFGESTPGEFRFSPDGGFALGTVYRTVSGFEFPDLVVFDLKTNARTAVAVPKDARVGTACWSPDGKRIAFVWESQAAFAERNKVLPGPINPGQKGNPKYIVTVARPDGSDAKDVYSEAEYGYGSIDWSAANFPVDQLPEKPTVDKPGRVRGEGQIMFRREGHPRELLYPDKPGPTPIIGRLTVNSHAMKQGTQVFSVGLEIDNLTASEATLHFDPKALKLELLDAKGKVVEESPTVQSGPAPMAHKATIPTSGYVGISTYRGGIGLTPKTILLAAGQQAWVLKPGTYRVRGTVTVSVSFGGKVLDPEKPEAPEPKPGNSFQTFEMELVGCRFELKMDENAPDR